MKRGRINIQPGKPLEFLDVVEDTTAPSLTHQEAVRIGICLRAYRKAADELLKGRYANCLEFAPRHLRELCDTFIVRCSDGIVVRYDPAKESKAMLRSGCVEESLSVVAPNFSEQMLHLPLPGSEIPIDTIPPGIDFQIRDAFGQIRQTTHLRFALVGSPTLPDGFILPPPPARPPPLLSIVNEFDLELHGHAEPVDPSLANDSNAPDQFVIHVRHAMAVGWLAIEVYSLLEDAHWNPDYAAMWAELDILAGVAQRNLQENKLHALDPRAEARERYAALLEEFESLLTGAEEPAHQFLKQHPELLSPTHERMWSKLRFGSTISDFVFRQVFNDYELVEIEAPTRELFRKDGQQRQELTHAINQIADWTQYIENNRVLVETELGLTGISTSPRTLVVIGRTESLTEENRRKLTTIQNQQPKLRILTYDDVLQNARTGLEKVFGPLSLRTRNCRVFYFK